jgi:hypothetical protein
MDAPKLFLGNNGLDRPAVVSIQKLLPAEERRHTFATK